MVCTAVVITVVKVNIGFRYYSMKLPASQCMAARLARRLMGAPLRRDQLIIKLLLIFVRHLRMFPYRFVATRKQLRRPRFRYSRDPRTFRSTIDPKCPVSSNINSLFYIRYLLYCIDILLLQCEIISIVEPLSNAPSFDHIRSVDAEIGFFVSHRVRCDNVR